MPRSIFAQLPFGVRQQIGSYATPSKSQRLAALRRALAKNVRNMVNYRTANRILYPEYSGHTNLRADFIRDEWNHYRLRHYGPNKYVMFKRYISLYTGRPEHEVANAMRSGRFVSNPYSRRPQRRTYSRRRRPMYTSRVRHRYIP